MIGHDPADCERIKAFILLHGTPLLSIEYGDCELLHYLL
jgi:hypothetical protein